MSTRLTERKPLCEFDCEADEASRSNLIRVIARSDIVEM